MRDNDQILLENLYSKEILNNPESQNKIKLIVIDGTLYTPFDVASDEIKNYYGDDEKEGLILAARGETGEPFTVDWPNFNPKNLAIALYDARETGYIPSNTKAVLLPDGTEFIIDDHGI